jgi:hypothetical protein
MKYNIKQQENQNELLHSLLSSYEGTEVNPYLSAILQAIHVNLYKVSTETASNRHPDGLSATANPRRVAYTPTSYKYHILP